MNTLALKNENKKAADNPHLPHFSGFRRVLPGLALTGMITALAIWLSDIPALNHFGLSALTLAIVIGMVIGNTVYPAAKPWCEEGVTLAKQRLLRLGIILYGLRLTFAQIADVGATGILTDALMLCSTFALACWLGQRVFKLDRDTSMLIGAGSSICGAAAVMATEPVLNAKAEKVTVAVATVVIFGTAAIFLYPWLWHLNAQYHWLSFTAAQFGIYTGSTVHEVAQVVAAGQGISPDAENAAVIAKMIRVMMLAPFLLLLSGWTSRKAGQQGGQMTGMRNITIPWFALLFILVAAVNSLNILPHSWIPMLITFDTVLLAMAMAALGLTTHISALRQAGLKPMLLAAVLFIWLIVGGAGINQLVQQLLG
ncbi:YeiH family protein [Rahnella perminowiae]|uniref:YeiH family protein n=1 Tax=Rahnella perminowiae TaxID=2816244 RepID=UPI001C268E8D|nr:YeiH family putative sulfate export transporter [Rahnella perminowiae]MBU9827395.1 YeiH family putative sulfate export transporter [Rahnella perminowiae]